MNNTETEITKKTYKTYLKAFVSAMGGSHPEGWKVIPDVTEMAASALAMSDAKNGRPRTYMSFNSELSSMLNEVSDA